MIDQASTARADDGGYPRGLRPPGERRRRRRRPDAAATPRSTVGALAALRHASSKSAVALSVKSGKTDDGSVLLAGNGAPLPRSREGSLLERLGAGLGLSAKEPP